MNEKKLEGLYSISHEIDVIIGDMVNMESDDFDQWKKILDRLEVQAGRLNALSTKLNAILRKHQEDGSNE